MLPSFLSPVSAYGLYLRRCFTAAGLSSFTLDVDHETTVHFWAPTNPTAQKPAVVLIHGFGPAAIWQWRQQVQFLAPHFNVYVPDLIFFGGSSSTSSERSETFQAASVGKLLDKLKVEKFQVVGTSYGGMVAYNLAKMFGEERVEKVVIASSGVNMKRSNNVALVQRAELEKIEDLMLPATPQQLRKLMSLSVYRTPQFLPHFLLNDFLHKLYSENRKEKKELLKGLTIGKDESSTLSPLQQGVLIVWGEQDQIFPVQMARELKEFEFFASFNSIFFFYSSKLDC
ncbi:pimeloyl-[acyl-carrier protein] methyl ester esterase-like isoform X2 [Vigna umbellata]|uniref:pimeloyl-[acyl-carrier protein] methyl ester esterase-like isoform X2 n=1 Tax=Vigna umbellata TaxID=87088 RepID=UPI001F5EF42E|nr:pimeloyl-[acyl-carrier protein] methyl ester esterase-like isoform X2 [Vigna umbellata]